MANARGKSIDNTHLSIDLAEERQLRHRDYYAHMFRWAHVARKLGSGFKFKTTRLLDVGCGVDVPLAKMLYSNRFITNDYVGLEYNHSKKMKTAMFKEDGSFPLNVYGSVDFASKQVLVRPPQFGKIDKAVCLYVDGDNFEGEHELPNVFTSFEVLEHVEPGHARAILLKIKILMGLCTEHYPNGDEPVAFISTPCFDVSVGAADNHVNEMRRDALGSVLESLGFEIIANYGTFASIRDYRDQLFHDYPDTRQIWEKLTAYYDSNTIALMFAPMYPEYSRNNMWVIREAKKDGKYILKFKSLAEVPKPWTSSAKAEELEFTGQFAI